MIACEVTLNEVRITLRAKWGGWLMMKVGLDSELEVHVMC
jgi:hypothetical protein